MKNKIKTIIICVSLIILIIWQCYHIYNKTFNDYIFNMKYMSDRININSLLLNNNLLVMKDYIDIKNNSEVWIIIDNKDNKYNVSIEKMYSQYLYNIISDPIEVKTIYYNEHDDIDEAFDYLFSNGNNKNKDRYVILVGNDMNLMGINTTLELSLYHYNEVNQKLELIKEMPNSLYNLKMNNISNRDYFTDVDNRLKIYLRDYKNYYGDDIYNIYYNFIIDSIEYNENYNLNSYIELYNSYETLDPNILLNRAYLYKYTGDLENYNFMIYACSLDSNCDEKRMKLIEKEKFE